MGKRRTSHQQRRRDTDIGKPLRHPGSRNYSSDNQTRVAPNRRQSDRNHFRTGESTDFAAIPDKEEERPESFAELVNDFLGVPAGGEPLQEKTRPSQRRPLVRQREFPAPQDELDLHRHTGPEAARRIENFIQTARGRGLLSLRIITGKGLHSDGRAVLREVAENKLLELKDRRLVTGFRWEQRHKEKSGAVIVYLESWRPRPKSAEPDDRGSKRVH